MRAPLASTGVVIVGVEDEMYAAFAKYRHPRFLDGCPCCTSTEESASLLNTPLRKVTPARLDRYAFKATTTWGSLDDYRFFLPRIFELTRQGSLLCDLEVTLGKLGTTSLHPGLVTSGRLCSTIYTTGCASP